MKLALYGQWEEISGLIYTFPEKLSPEQSSELPGWSKSLFDPRYVRGIFKGDYCYALWYNGNGYYYSCIKTNTDSRNGCVMLTLCAGDKVPLDGKVLVEKMRMLLDYCLSKSNYKEINYVEVQIRAKEIESLLMHKSLLENAFSTPDKEMAYRLYGNDDELGLVMENPNQTSYAGYKRILIIEESKFGGDAVLSQSITQITVPVRKNYYIRSDSNDVVASKDALMEGETFTITYKKSGYADECVNVVAGKTSGYYNVEGSVINLKPASAVGINFKREIVIQVFDEENNAVVKNCSCKIDGRFCNDAVANANGSVSLHIDAGKSHKITVSADGYENKELEIAVGEYGRKTVRLHSADEAILVKLKMGKKLYSDRVKLKSNNELYYPLKRMEEKRETLQVKRPFFSLRNLLPILLVFVIAATAGLFTGRGIWKKDFSCDSINDTVVVLNDSISKLNDSISKLNYSISQFQNLKDTERESRPSATRDVDTGKNNNGSKTEGELEKEDLEYFAQHKDKWDLGQLKSTNYKKLANYIITADINQMISYNSKICNQNENWKNICSNLSVFWDANKDDRTLVEKVKNSINECIDNNTFNLKDLLDKLVNLNS